MTTRSENILSFNKKIAVMNSRLRNLEKCMGEVLNFLSDVCEVSAEKTSKNADPTDREFQFTEQKLCKPKVVRVHRKIIVE